MYIAGIISEREKRWEYVRQKFIDAHYPGHILAKISVKFITI
jgi:hypothetical protein